MKWQIQGADRATGEEKMITVEAVDDMAAMLRAKEKNILVADLRIVTPIPNYQTPQSQPCAAPSETGEFSAVSRKLADRASGLEGIAIFFTVIGWLGVLMMIGSIVAAILLMVNAQRQELVTMAMVCLLSGIPPMVLGFGISALLRMLAAIGLGVREIMHK